MDVTSAAGSILAAFGLSGAAGLNAWIPLFVTALLGRTGAIDLAAPYDGLESTLGQEGYERYAPQIAVMRKTVEKTASDTAPALDLAKAIATGLMSDKPKSRYHAGKGAEEAIALARVASDSIKDRAIAHEVGPAEAGVTPSPVRRGRLQRAGRRVDSPARRRSSAPGPRSRP